MGSVAELLDAAQQRACAVEQPSDMPDVPGAYRIQHELVGRRLSRGERLVGCKLGFTSKAKMAQMGVNEVIAGQLTNAMRTPDGSDIRLVGFIHPRIEPEVAFRIARDVDFTDPAADMESAVDAIAPAMEIIDSRYRDFRFNLPAVIADNASAAAFVVGPWHSLGGDVGNRAVQLSVDGRPAEFGSTAAILGHPVRALHALASLARRYGLTVRAGTIVLAGAATVAVPLTAATVTTQVAGMGQVSVRGVDG